MKKTMWKRCLAMLLCLMMLMMTACSKQTSEKETEATKATDAPKTTEAPEATDAATEVTTEAVEYPDYVTDPVTIELWHTRASGANGDNMQAMIDEFNATNEYGITVVGTYQGGYSDTLAKVTAAVTAGDNPVLAILGAGGIENMYDAGILADMTDYVARDGFDTANIPEGIQYYMNKTDYGVFPYLVSSCVLYYNKDYWNEENLPDTIQELYAGAKAIKDEYGIYGYGIHIDACLLQRPILMSLGSNGLIKEGGDAVDSLENGEMLTLWTDWLAGINEGYLPIPEVNSADQAMRSLFYAGECAMFGASSGGMKNIMTASAEAGIDLGVAPYVGYDGKCAAIGGGSMGILQANHTQQEVAAAWEFVKFLYKDENIVRLHSETGYLPMTYTSSETEECKTFWESNPGYKTAFEQLSYAKYDEFSFYTSEWKAKVKEATQLVIITQDMTPEEAVDFLKQQAAAIFP